MLCRIREEKQVQQELNRRREEAESVAIASQSGKLCATPYRLDVVGVTEFILLIGALVGGLTARARRKELEGVNEKLRMINLKLREQARAGITYAPVLLRMYTSFFKYFSI